MKGKFIKRGVASALITVMALSTFGCGKSSSDSTASNTEASQGNGAITVTMGRQTLQNVKLPNGDTYENNAYTRMAEKELNIKIKDAFEANGDDYDRQVSLALSSGDMPDIMKVNTLDDVKELYENGLIADLTDSYKKDASDNLKSVYDSYNGRALANVTYDGKIMAIPGTNGDSGPSIVWVRSDWTKELGITLDSDGDGCISVDELQNLAKEFMNKNPGKAQDPVGIAVTPYLTSSDPDGTYTLNSLAYACNAFPKTWYKKDGKLVYGSTTDEMKKSLEIASQWYKDGILDPQVGTRTWDDITALLANGQTGITFGTWHIPDWLLSNVYAMDPKATFDAYTLENSDGKVNCKHNDATSGYMVVSKKFKHPEIVVKLANLFYDKLGNDPSILQKYPDVAEYIKDGVDGSARPMNIEINASSSLLDDYQGVEDCLNGKITIDQLKKVDQKSNVTAIQQYMSGSEDATGWSKYHSRIKGVGLLKKLEDTGKIEWMTPEFPYTTETQKTNQANLDKLEEETFIKIVTGELDVDKGFDQFVSDWKSQGGTQITKEIESQLKKS